MRSPIKWRGGKARLAKAIISYFPEHQTYVEVFGGGAAVLFNKDLSPVEVYNDIDKSVVNFFLVLSDPEMYEQFVRRVSVLPYSRELYNKSRAERFGVVDPVEWAAVFFVMARQSFGGVPLRSWGYGTGQSARGMGGSVAAWFSAIELLPEVHFRLQSVMFECNDWYDVITAYDGVDTLFYLDPPYIPDTRTDNRVYDNEMSLDEHTALIDVIQGVEGKVIISGYPHPLYGILDQVGWERREFDISCNAVGRVRHSHLRKKQKAGAKRPSPRRTECIWMNFEPEDQDENA
jgi:DNA adenine methylase